MTRPGPAPIARAAAMNSCSRNDSTLPRMIRATAIQPSSDSTSTTSKMLSPSIRAPIITTIKPGSASSVSVNRINTASARPPVYPATMPISVPPKVASNATDTPTASVTRPA